MHGHQTPEWGGRLACGPLLTTLFTGHACTGLLRRIAAAADPISRLKDRLGDLYRDPTSGEFAGIRKVEELVVP